MSRACLVFALAVCSNSTARQAPAEKRVDYAPAAIATTPAALSGIWLGTLQTGDKPLRVQIHLDFASKPSRCSLDSLDQGSTGIPCNNVIASATELSIEVPTVDGSLKGSVSADANTVTATWTQNGVSMPLVLT